jgi:hypothetical protein
VDTAIPHTGGRPVPRPCVPSISKRIWAMTWFSS